MTPPLPASPLGGAAKIDSSAEVPAPHEGKPAPLGPGGGAPLNPVDTFVPMDDSAPAEYKTVQDLLAALGDEPLFGKLGYAKYNPERNGKYLEVTVAVLEIKKLIRGDSKSSAEAVKKIGEWLNKYELLTDTNVSHVARVNLIKALQRAPKGAGIDAAVKDVLAALQKQYNPKPPEAKAPSAKEAPKAKENPPPKAASSLAEALSDRVLFDKHFDAYDKERNKTYAPVSIAILEVKKVAKGEASSAAEAKAKLVAWLKDEKLLKDPVAHQARLGLIAALNAAPKGTEAYNQAIADLSAALKANYGAAGAPAKKEPAKPEVDSKTKAGPKGLAELNVNPKSKTKAKREDDAKSLSNGMTAAVKPAMSRLLKKYDSLSVKCQMTLSIDESSGQVITVSFKDIKTGANISAEDTRELLETIANNIRARFRFKPMGESGLAFIKVPLSIVGQ
ncbi:MAG: hypothetical protein IT573_10935 [Deltaproteobacteria bacterium]|nr:hypothetical protein [Deltaproteobacteria bacterium]